MFYFQLNFDYYIGVSPDAGSQVTMAASLSTSVSYNDPIFGNTGA